MHVVEAVAGPVREVTLVACELGDADAGRASEAEGREDGLRGDGVRCAHQRTGAEMIEGRVESLRGGLSCQERGAAPDVVFFPVELEVCGGIRLPRVAAQQRVAGATKGEVDGVVAVREAVADRKMRGRDAFVIGRVEEQIVAW